MEGTLLSACALAVAAALVAGTMGWAGLRTRSFLLAAGGGVAVGLLLAVPLARHLRSGAESEAVRQAAVLESVLASMADGVIVADAQGRFTFFNPAAEKILGLGATTAPTADWPQRYGVFRPDGVTPMAEGELPLVRAIRGEEALDVDMIVANPSLPAPLAISASARPLRDADSHLGGGVVVFRDVTQRRRAHEEIASLNHDLSRTVEALQESSSELEAFSYSVSHDLRGPIRHISGFADLLQRRSAPLDETAQHYLDQIREATRRMGALIDDLLELSRTSRTEIHAAPVALASLVHEVKDALQPEIGGREVIWQVEALPVVHGDHALLRVVLMNLFQNAIKFSPDVPVRIAVAAESGDGEARVSVRDEGVGFDMQFAHKLFGVFERLHGGDEFEGTGIGLATVRRIVLRHGGRVWAESGPGRGATFSFSLPLEAPPA